MRITPSTQPLPRRPAPGPTGYRAGIIGAGFMGRVHARSVRVAGGRVVGVAASTPHRAAAAAGEVGAERAFSDAAALIGADEVEVVHICTPNHLHAPLVEAALAAGKHVVCEKPLATTAADAAALAAAASAAGAVATVPFVYRFHPMVREARERIRNHELGAISLIHGTYLQDWLTRPADHNWRVDREQGGPSRAFADIGSHWCDLVEFVTGCRITRLCAQAMTVHPQRQRRPVTTEDAVTVQFEAGTGIVGAAVISQVSPGRKNRLYLEISGTEASLAFDQEQPELLWQGGREQSRLLVRDPESLSKPAVDYTRVPAGHAQGYQDCFDFFVADTAAAIRGQPPDGLPTFTDGLRAAQLTDAVLRSAAQRAWVEVPG